MGTAVVINTSSPVPHQRCCPYVLQVIIPLDFEKTEQMERFVRVMEGVIQERAHELAQHREEYHGEQTRCR